MKRLIFLFAISLFACSIQAQTLKTSPFHRLIPPEKLSSHKYGVSASNKVTAWRFTAAAASFDVVNNKILTGIGYGFNSMHSTAPDANGNAVWYTDFTANLSVYAAGNATPTYSYGNTNIVGIGPSLGILNKLINVGYVFYPAMNGGASKSGIIAGISIPLN